MQPVTSSRTDEELASLRQCLQQLDLVLLPGSVEDFQWVQPVFVNGRSLLLLFQSALAGEGYTGWEHLEFVSGTLKGLYMSMMHILRHLKITMCPTKGDLYVTGAFSNGFKSIFIMMPLVPDICGVAK